LTLLHSLANLLDSSRQRPAHIDVKELMGQLSDAELLQAADAYFASLDIGSEQCHKPFSNVADAIHITRSVSLLLQAADVFRGADVLDFGCATGWLTHALASLGCNAVGVDVSPSALHLAQRWCDQRGVRAGGAVQFKVYDGHRLPLDDNSVDRVVCMDAFHHVKDQAATLLELARVLRPGGRIAMVEPGPNHSKSTQSQAEMSQFKVIENDIVMTEVASAAVQAGLLAPQMLLLPLKPWVVPFDQYLQWADAAALPKGDAARLLANLHRHLTTQQVFYLEKPGNGASLDSRRPHTLAAKIRLLSAATEVGGGGVVNFRIRNTGESNWLSQVGVPGQVNLGCQLIGPDHAVVQLDFARFSLGNADLAPGATVECTVRLGSPPVAGGYYRFDLVAEQIAWFQQSGRCKPVLWHPVA
jgi:2-polyprenyl-3-methyl-5-hydroxy-6-metoxy-1,4-benzoquinol methylase